MNEWITSWDEVADDGKYIVCCIGQRDDKTMYLYKPEMNVGWQVKRLMQGCYAALPMPEFQGITSGKEVKSKP